MIKNYITEPGSSIILKNKNGQDEVSLYSQEGLEMLSNLWIKVAAEFKLNYELKWLGRPIIQFGSDMVMLQELIWEVKPDIFIETGIAHGGSLIYTASLFEMIGNGKVIGIDVEIREHNRVAIVAHPMYKRISMIEGSSVDDSTILALEKQLELGKKIMVMLDSNHSRNHVLNEMKLYSKYVPVGSYLIVQDGAQKWVADIPRGKPEWIDDNPLNAIDDFLKTNSDFVVDETYTRLGITQSPKGFLKRINYSG
jgi:cephalosporin hydroxylase